MTGRIKRKVRRGKRGGRRLKKNDDDSDASLRRSKAAKSQKDKKSTVKTVDLPAIQGCKRGGPLIDNSRFLTGANAIDLYRQDDKEAEHSGRGSGNSRSELPHNDRKYVLGIEEELDRLVGMALEGETEDSSINMLCHNTITQLEGKILTVAADPETSRVVQKILWASKLQHLLTLAHVFKGRCAELSKDQFASHVFQVFIYTLLYGAVDGKDGCQEHVIMEVRNIVETICNELSDEISNLVTNKYASHVVNVILCVLNSRMDSQTLDHIRSDRSKEYNIRWKLDRYNEYFTRSKERQPRKVDATVTNVIYPALAEKFSLGILQVVKNKTSILIRDPCAIHVMQRLMDIGSSCNEIMVETIGLSNESITEAAMSGTNTDISFNPDFFSLFFHKIGSHFVEKLLKVANTSILYFIYQNYFHNRLKELIGDPVANFIVQTLLKCLKNSVQASVVIGELLQFMKELVEAYRPGVLAGMFEASKLYKVYQKELSEGLASNLDVHQPNLIFRVLSLSPQANTNDDNLWYIRKFNIMASLVAQSWLDFDKKYSGVIASGVMSLSPQDFLSISCNPIGSHFIESFFMTANISNKIKKKKVVSLSSLYPDLAQDKYGSHVFEKMWISSDLPLKKAIAHELLVQKSKLSESQYGRIILQKFKIDTLVENAQEWVEKQTSAVGRKRNIDAIFKESLIAEKQTPESRGILEVQKIDPLWSKSLFHKDLFKWDADEERKLYCAINLHRDSGSLDDCKNVDEVNDINNHKYKKAKVDSKRKLKHDGVDGSPHFDLCKFKSNNNSEVFA